MKLDDESDVKSIHIGELRTLEIPIAVVTITLSSFAIFLSVLFFIFNIKYRNFRWIKMSSPKINNIINLNCILLYLCPIFNAVKGLNITNITLANVLCQINVWLLPICSTIVYASILAKAWRIFKIFDTVSKFQKIVIKDHLLVIYIFIILSIDVTILCIWQFFDHIHLTLRFILDTNKFKYSKIYTHNQVDKTSFNVITSLNLKNHTKTSYLKIVYECDSSYDEIWIILLTLYKMIQLMYGIYLAWEIRNVTVPSMNDSKYLLFSSYTIIGIGLSSMTLIHLLRDWPDVVQVIFTLGIVIATGTSQYLLFIPKILLWYKKRNDDNLKISLSEFFLQPTCNDYYANKKCNNIKKSTNHNSNKDVQFNFEDEICTLLHENNQLKNFLKKKEEFITILEQKIRATKESLFEIDDQKRSNLKYVNSTNENIDDCKNDDSKNKINERFTHAITVIPKTSDLQYQNKTHKDSGFDFISINSTNKNESIESKSEYSSLKELSTIKSMDDTPSSNDDYPLLQKEKLKMSLDEVMNLTSRVRNSISVDLSNVRQFSPLLYEYYHKKLELVKSIQSTYNIKCDMSSYNAIGLMQKCLKNNYKTVHNPEYIDIDLFNETSIYEMPSLSMESNINQARLDFNDQNNYIKTISYTTPFEDILKDNKLNTNLLYPSAVSNLNSPKNIADRIDSNFIDKQTYV